MIRRTSLSVAFMVGLMVAACLATVGAADKKKAAPAAAPVWPLPPDLPRIRYVTAYHGLTDFKSVYSIFVSRVDVYTEKYVPELSPSAQGTASRSRATAASSSPTRRRGASSCSIRTRSRSPSSAKKVR